MKKLEYLLIALILLSLTFCKKNKIEKKACSEGPMLIQYNDTSIVYLPNIFTPNGDGMNDMLCVRGELQSLHLTIKDGSKKIFETNSQSQCWDGKFKGKIRTGIFKCDIKLTLLDGSVMELKDFKVSSVTENDYSIENCNNCFFDSQFNGVKLDSGAVYKDNSCK